MAPIRVRDAKPPGSVPERMRRTATHSGALDAILMASREAIVVLNDAGVITAWSRGAELAYGYFSHEAVGQNALELLVPPKVRGVEEKTRLALLAGGLVPPFESVRIRKDGTRADVLVMAQVIRDASGNATGLCSVEREVEEGRLAAEVARLQERDRQRIDFLSEAAHELNTPLTPIRLQLQLLKESQGLGVRDRTNVDAIERNVLRLGLLVQDMLDASRLQAGRFRLERERLDLSRLVKEAGTSFRASAEQEGLRLDVAAPEGLTVLADANRTMQVLFNLLSNAIKFTPRGGRIEVRTRRQGDEAIVRVHDTGIGLTMEQIGLLFRPFGRLHESQPGVAKGTGLGLFISKGIVERHGGRIWVESPGTGQGSTWFFTMPLAAEEGEAAAVGPTVSY